MDLRHIVPALGLAAILALPACSTQALPKGDYGTVHGLVKSNSGAPIPGAQITIDTVLQASTAADGSYTIGNVPADGPSTSTMVAISAPGYTCSPNPQSIKVAAQATTEADFTCSQ